MNIIDSDALDAAIDRINGIVKSWEKDVDKMAACTSGRLSIRVVQSKPIGFECTMENFTPCCSRMHCTLTDLQQGEFSTLGDQSFDGFGIAIGPRFFNNIASHQICIKCRNLNLV